jgi:catechol 2,3-dioxygenase-like lactoylglutathione lyase family enzyme
MPEQDGLLPVVTSKKESPMIVGIDHVVILVQNLATAIDDYTALGFTVTPGGEHADGATHNALIAFADGSYLELLAFRRHTPDHRWWRPGENGEGLIDWALLPDAIANDIAQAAERGIMYDVPVAGGRVRPDGQEVAWEMAMPRMAGLPFLCGDVTPRVLRVPEGEACEHANGATGIAGVTVAVDDIETSSQHYRALLTMNIHPYGRPYHATPPTRFTIPETGARMAIFPAGHAMVTLAEPSRESRESTEADATFDASSISLSQQLVFRGVGPYALTLYTRSGGDAGVLDPALTHGVRLELIPD